jgi:hypothetical protein
MAEFEGIFEAAVGRAQLEGTVGPVSYTHLTLPTTIGV